MNKKGETTIVEVLTRVGFILLCLILLILASYFTSSKAEGAINDVFDKIMGKEKVVESSKDLASYNFNKFLENLGNCKTDNCFCDEKLRLPDRFQLRIKKEKVALEYLGGEELENKDFDLSCILGIKDNKLVIEDKEFLVKFDKDEPRIVFEKRFWFDNDINFYGDKWIFKKDGRYCWASENVKNLNDKICE